MAKIQSNLEFTAKLQRSKYSQTLTLRLKKKLNSHTALVAVALCEQALWCIHTNRQRPKPRQRPIQWLQYSVSVSSVNTSIQFYTSHFLSESESASVSVSVNTPLGGSGKRFITRLRLRCFSMGWRNRNCNR